MSNYRGLTVRQREKLRKFHYEFAQRRRAGQDACNEVGARPKSVTFREEPFGEPEPMPEPRKKPAPA